MVCYRCASDTIQNKQTKKKTRSVQSSKMSRDYLQDELYAWVWVGEGPDPAVRTL